MSEGQDVCASHASSSSQHRGADEEAHELGVSDLLAHPTPERRHQSSQRCQILERDVRIGTSAGHRRSEAGGPMISRKRIRVDL